MSAGDGASDKASALRVLDTALAEFLELGAVTTARCDQCGQLLAIEALRDTAFAVSCNCGKYNDTLRGL